MTFKEKLVKLRKLKGLTQDEFAKAVGVSRQAVYKWESGQSYPEVAKLLEIKLLFGISIDDLLDENYEVIVPEKKKKKRAPKTAEATLAEEEMPAAEEVPVTVNAPEEEKAEVHEEPLEEKAELPAEDIQEENKKKTGFFGRLFGRK